ncbi:PIN domain-containing protein [Sphaerisporangium album]|uniref:PIN domain-containing protein n=1 Tax=Sphaerisporangium album TaxID=509200 RepID=A0A367FQ00_9ACTN|nr:type II toxin-antitoxin system VapC family toxin [Sphaerisporangium album]RCG32486.1 PIN domain-containing protein [Sphaerisporangium album]
MIVIDSSAMVDALVDYPVKTDLMDLIAEQELHAPALLDFEVTSAIRGHLLGKKLNESQIDGVLGEFNSLRVRRYQMNGALRHLLDLRDNFTTYDAAYVVLAKALNAPLLTADVKMKTAQKFGVQVRIARNTDM